MNDDDINDYIPSVLNPRVFRKQNGALTLTQNSVVSRCSLSLKKTHGISNVKRTLHKIFSPDKESSQYRNNLVLQPLVTAKNVSRIIDEQTLGFIALDGVKNRFADKENIQNNCNILNTRNKTISKDKTIEQNSIGFSAIEDLNTPRNNNDSSPFSFGDIQILRNDNVVDDGDISLISLSSATELNERTRLHNTDSTVVYEVAKEPVVSLSFGIINCTAVDISTKNTNIKKMLVSHENNMTICDCELEESSHISILESDTDVNMIEAPNLSLLKKSTVAVNLEIKKKNLVEETIENSKVLILNTNDIEKLSHVIVQPPNYKLVKRQILDRSKFKNCGKRKPILKNGKSVHGHNLIQKRIDAYLNRSTDVIRSEKTFIGLSVNQDEDVVFNDGQDMSKNLGVADAVKCDHIGTAAFRGVRKDELSPRSIRLRPKPDNDSPRQQTIRVSSSDARRVPSRGRNDSSNSQSPRKNVESVQFNLPSKSKSTKTSLSPRNIPHYKIVAGTHFAVDAFSYGEIPNVKHYFLTHFHSDHYSGLKKAFSKFLFCSKITADLCVSRLGVNPKCIHVINFDETITVDGVEVTAVDANHCPGAIMLIFTLPNGKTLLHTGDFRASPLMESYPVFWNKDINTVYLDTTYCNPRYDFPTQDQSLEMALYLLRQKKLALEKIGKKFSSVLIVCGTYTIGKEKFFLGMARRVGCSVWACPEKDRVLQAVEGRSFSHAPPHSCQLHVVPMRDLTHEKLRCYLDSLQGAFTEVVAFKPSGWENGKNSTMENDRVTIHGIPYSEHSSFSELIRFVKYLKPKQVVPTVDISGGVKAVQKYFSCPLVCKEDLQSQSKVTDYFSIQNRQQVPAVT